MHQILIETFIVVGKNGIGGAAWLLLNFENVFFVIFSTIIVGKNEIEGAAWFFSMFKIYYCNF